MQRPPRSQDYAPHARPPVDRSGSPPGPIAKSLSLLVAGVAAVFLLAYPGIAVAILATAGVLIAVVAAAILAVDAVLRLTALGSATAVPAVVRLAPRRDADAERS